ncbi:MAG: ParA family protein [Candidatus Promineifilaceae bacterium]|jgi:cellulose biosynthesis protein BcsQ
MTTEAEVRESSDRECGVLQSTIPYLSHVEQMGTYRQPVPVFAPTSPASWAYQYLWKKIHMELLNERK